MTMKRLLILLLSPALLASACGQQPFVMNATTGAIEAGFVRVADMIARQPSLDGDYAFPVQVTDGAATPPRSEPALSA